MSAVHLMRVDTPRLSLATAFEEIVCAVYGSSIGCIPVVDDEGRYLGMIQRENVSRWRLEPSFKLLVNALDLAESNIPTVTPDTRASVLQELFQRFDLDALAVLGGRTGERFIGMVSRGALARVSCIERAENEIERVGGASH